MGAESGVEKGLLSSKDIAEDKGGTMSEMR